MENDILTSSTYLIDDMTMVCSLANFHQLSKFNRNRIIGLRESGMSLLDFTLLLSCEWRCWWVLFEEGRDQRAKGTGRQRKTTKRQDRPFRLLGRIVLTSCLLISLTAENRGQRMEWCRENTTMGLQMECCYL